ncbi:two-component regulator propeller domain-containing protein [Rhodocytophaga aerolata]|uniref:histidine kinase n=1 Tax=Rhodocytophaga aerolata TaxID=455078 RepID=A0ABT8R161_9BACT|nr:sensor histidine kinase [Rhodocytophaga aerolata]MDO1444988.1 two-component regulator propeller domain-containing protein [Rhodocytophaga aerolata]
MRKLFTYFPYLFFLMLFLFWPSLKTWASKPQVSFKRYTVQDGLSNNYVRKILQDSEGFIWVATEDGLNKFDSYTFQVYKHIPGDSTSLTNHPIVALVEDNDHNVWVGTWGGGIFIYNRKLDNFRQLKHVPQQNTSLSSNYIYDLYKDSKGRIWVGTNGYGLNLCDTQKYTFKSYIHDRQDSTSISHNRVSAITEDKQGKLWIGTIGGGVNQFDPATGIFQRYLHENGNEQSLSHNDVFSILWDSKDRLWVGTWNNGLNLKEGSSHGFTRFSYLPSANNSLTSNQVWALVEDGHNRVWIGTDKGLCLYNEAQKSFYTYHHDSFDPKSLAGNSVKSLYGDKQGRLWVGTNNNGLCLTDPYLTQMGHYYTKIGGNSLTHNDVSAFLAKPSGQVLIGTDGGGLNVLNPARDSFVAYRHDYNNPFSIGSNKIKAMLADRRQGIWIGFWDGGLDYFDSQQKVFTHFRKGKAPVEGQLNNDNVTCLAQDQDGYVWLGTFGGGISRFDPVQKKFTAFTQKANNRADISDNFVWALLVDTLNNVWIGTSNGYLDVLDNKREWFKHIPLQKPGETGYAVRALVEDNKGRIWIGTGGGGLKLLQKKDSTFKTFTVANGLPSNTINAIEEDNKGLLWLGTNQGIVRFDPETERCQIFGISAGVQSLQFNRQASGKLYSGELLFGGNNGFNLFHPDSLKQLTSQVPLVWIDFQIFNKPVPIGKDNSPLQARLNQTQAITLDYKQSVFSIEYAALNYTAPEDIQYAYRLKGFTDESWQQAGTTRKVTYTNLAPKRYVFELTTVTEGTIAVPSRTLTIIITPPWWHTWWARLVFLLATSTLLTVLYYWRIRRIRAQNKKLEKKVTQRTVELQKANESLKEMNRLIQDQKEEIKTHAQELETRVELRTTDLKKTNEELDNFVYRVSHDIRAPLSSILGLVTLIKLEQDPAQQQLYLQMIDKSINKLDGFVKDILDYSRNSRITINQEEINFPELVDNVHAELQYMENAHQLKLLTDFKLEAPHYNDVRRLHIILRNLFSNAIKYQNLHADQSFLHIHIQTDTHFATITVKDNGIGIDPCQQEKVFDMFYRGSQLSNSSGLGLYIVKEAIEKLKGSIHLQSELGVGTTFIIKLPTMQPKEE